MFGKPEDGWTAGGFVATDAFENRAAITDDVRKDVNFSVVPRDKLPITPDLLGGL